MFKSIGKFGMKCLLYLLGHTNLLFSILALISLVSASSHRPYVTLNIQIGAERNECINTIILFFLK